MDSDCDMSSKTFEGDVHRPSSGSSRGTPPGVRPQSGDLFSSARSQTGTPSIPEDKSYCRLANFDIEKKIGRGQFSVVYRAKCRVTNAVVALKKVQVDY